MLKRRLKRTAKRGILFETRDGFHPRVAVSFLFCRPKIRKEMEMKMKTREPERLFWLTLC